MIPIVQLTHCRNLIRDFHLTTHCFSKRNGRIARIILLSTVLAFFTFTGAVALLVSSAGEP